MKTLEKPNGIWGTILLPINNNQIDWVAFEEQIHILCDSKVSGIYTNGTAAELSLIHISEPTRPS